MSAAEERIPGARSLRPWNSGPGGALAGSWPAGLEPRRVRSPWFASLPVGQFGRSTGEVGRSNARRVSSGDRTSSFGPGHVELEG